jgi:Rps23 Pro-64 3,4-dihydroxylase Tpa1-like proline 4-hydroxylase
MHNGPLNKGQEVAPGIVIHDNIIQNSKELIDLANIDQNIWQDALVYTDRSSKDKSYRSAQTVNIPFHYSMRNEWFNVYKIIWEYSQMYAAKQGSEFYVMEDIEVIHYKKNSDFFKEHVDKGKENTREVSALLYLNDVELGGETYFKKFDVSIKPKAGRLVFFPSNYVYIHEAKPPISNDKFLIVTWLKLKKDYIDN